MWSIRTSPQSEQGAKLDAMIRDMKLHTPGGLNLQLPGPNDLVSQMTVPEKSLLADQMFRIQSCRGDRADMEAIVAFYVRRRMRDEVDEAWVERELGSLRDLWRKNPRYDGRD